MNMSKATMNDVLRDAIEKSGLTGYRIAKETGIPEIIFRRFARGEMSVGLDKADNLPAFLGFRLTPDPDAVPPTSTPENLARPTLAKRRAKRKAN